MGFELAVVRNSGYLCIQCLNGPRDGLVLATVGRSRHFNGAALRCGIICTILKTRSSKTLFKFVADFQFFPVFTFKISFLECFYVSCSFLIERAIGHNLSAYLKLIKNSTRSSPI